MRIAVAGIAGAVAVLLCTAPVAAGGDEEALFGKRYHSVSVTKDGQPFGLVRGTKLRIGFSRHRGSDWAGWDSGCNAFGAEITLEEDVIDFEPPYQTLMGCTRRLLRQDAFFDRFFASDPAWTASGRELTLWNERVTVELRRRVTLPG